MTLARLSAERLAYGGATVFDGVSLVIRAGERVVLVGPSGAGKTTLLMALHARMVADGLRVALAPQEAGLVPQLSVVKNTLMGRLDDHGALHNLAALVHTPKPARAEILALLAELGLSEQAQRAVEGLSGGQRQRVSLARALYRGGQVFLGDEPVSAVDETQAEALLAVVARHFETSVLSLHDLTLARSFASRIIGVRKGALVFDAPPAQVTPAQFESLYAA